MKYKYEPGEEVYIKATVTGVKLDLLEDSVVYNLGIPLAESRVNITGLDESYIVSRREINGTE